MTVGDPLIDELRVRGVIERYCSLLDTGAAHELLGLFDENCTFAMMGRTYHGRVQLASVWGGLTRADRPSTLHAVVSPVISVDGDRATAVTGWAMLDRSAPEGATVIALAGRYLDELARDADGSWRFVDRRVQTLARPQSRTVVDRP